MSVVLAFLARAWPYLLPLGIGLGTGGYLAHFADSTRYERLQTDYSGYRAQVADANEKAQEAARNAEQAQIQRRLDTEANNGKIIAQLQTERDSAAADAAFARRLLSAAQARPTAPSSPVPQAGHQPGTPPEAETRGDGRIVDLVSAAAGESRACIRQLNALLDELTPQL